MNLYELKELIRNNKIISNKYYELDTGETFLGKSKDRVEFIKKNDLIKEVKTDLKKKQDKPDTYKEFTFDSNDNLVMIEFYENETKAKKTLIKRFRYDEDSNLINIESEYLLLSKTENKELSYDSSGNITNININE